MSWREIAWNGVCFSAPAAWETAKIGPRYLLLTDQGEPALEIKWERVKGGFSPGTALKRLKAMHGDTVNESPLPEAWEGILGDFAALGFVWQTKTGGGRGVILHCPDCGNVTLIQFFGTLAGSIGGTCRRVLASFEDHRLDNRVCWSLFDIRAEIPAEYPLVRYGFEAGRFELHFGTKRQQIALYRWGPASVLLGNGDLVAFAAQTTGIDRSEWSRLTWTGHPAVRWAPSVSGGIWTRWRERMMGKPHFQWFQLWHLLGKNRLLGVGANGNRSIRTELLDRICTTYESL